MKTIKIIFLILNILFVLQLYSQSCGDLDPAFGNSGVVTTDFYGSTDYCSSLVIQQDGRIIAVGTSYPGSNIALTRYNPDGTPDVSFSDDGKVTFDIYGNEDRGNAVAIQEDGKILVAGSSGTDVALIRCKSDGSLDSSFSDDGMVTTDIYGSNDFGYSVAIQDDGKIVVSGSSGMDFVLIRYNTNGSLDQAFSNDGIALIDFYNSFDVCSSVALQDDGKIIAAGVSYLNSNKYVAMVRYNSNGIIDSTFSVNGKVYTSIGGSDDYGSSIAIQPDGKIVFTNRNDLSVKLMRYNPNGTLDTSFSDDGMTSTIIGGIDDAGHSLALQQDGKILVAGWSNNGSDFDFALIRYNANGSLDSTFSYDGILTTAIGVSHDNAYSIGIQQDGMIVVAGTVVVNCSDVDFAIVRYACEASSVINHDYENELSIYPNPASDEISICNSDKEDRTINIYDIAGKLIRSEKIEQHYNQISIIDLNSGVYWLEILTPESRRTKKLVIQK